MKLEHKIISFLTVAGMHVYLFPPLILIQTSYKFNCPLTGEELSGTKTTFEMGKFHGTAHCLEARLLSGRQIHLVVGMGERITAKKFQL